jgi:hypothetical protein
MDLRRQNGSASVVATAELTAGVKRFNRPEQLLVFDSGRLEVITVGGKAIGKGSYTPGWRWSRCAAPAAAARWAPAETVGVVLSGQARVQLQEGTEVDLNPGDFFHTVMASGYDEWVVGQRPCEILYLSGVEGLIRQLRAAA